MSGVSTAEVKPIDSPMSSAVIRRMSPTLRKPSRPADGATHEDVAPERELVGEGPLLVDGLDAQRSRLLDGESIDPLAAEEDLARVRTGGPR